MTVGERFEDAADTHFTTLCSDHHLLDIGCQIIDLSITALEHRYIMDPLLKAIVQSYFTKGAAHDAINVLRGQASIIPSFDHPLGAEPS